MTDRIQHARDWIAAQLQTEAAMTPGPLRVEPGWIDPDCFTLIDAEGMYHCETHKAERAEQDAAGIALARNQHRALLLIADDNLHTWQQVLANIEAMEPSSAKLQGMLVLRPIAEQEITRTLARLADAGYTEAQHD